MNKRKILFFLTLSLLLFVGVGRYVFGNFEFLLKEFWSTSGFLLLILVSLITKLHFLKGLNIIISIVIAGVSLLLVKEEDRNWIFWLFLGVTLYLAVSSFIVLGLQNKPLYKENKSLQFFLRINREIGQLYILFSVFYLWCLINGFVVNSSKINALFLNWILFLYFLFFVCLPGIVNILNRFIEKKKTKIQRLAIGEIFAEESRSIILVKLFKERKETINLFDFVEFVYSVDEERKARKGLIFDTFLLDGQQWIKVLATAEINQMFYNKDIYILFIPIILYI